MQMCRDLKFTDEPDYSKMRRLFKDLYNKCCFEHDYIFDWTIQRYRLDLTSFKQMAEQLQDTNNQKQATLPDSLKG
jgi:hypothetical protein